jgi:hypothetical protein
MAYLKDVEGEPLNILDYYGNKSFEAYISPDYDKDSKLYTGISIAVKIPEYLTDGENSYASNGLLIASLSKILDEYIDGSEIFDNGESLPTLSKLLREYADKADAKSKELNPL